MANSLDVYVQNTLTGQLSRSEQDRHAYVFAYKQPNALLNPVSIIMPVRLDQYIYGHRLHPVFDMNLPEGWLKDRLRTQFSKAIPHFDDLDLLEIVGRSQIGNLRFMRSGSEMDDVPDCDLNKVLAYTGAEDLLESLLAQYGAYSGVSGAQPKVLVRDLHTFNHPGRITHKVATHIIKSWKEEYPELAANEFFCMRAAKHAGLEVPELTLSNNGQFLIVKRFDLAEGAYWGFEDFCALSAQPSMKKYDGSYERIAKHIKYFVSPEKVNQALRDFFKSFVLSCAVKNGDAHLKNFGLLYDSSISAVWLSPTYDIVSTTPYNKNDTLALMVKGSKKWPTERNLIRFGTVSCELSAAQIRDIMDEVANGIAMASAEMQNYMSANKNFRDMGSIMLDEWRNGVALSLGIKIQP